ncbi:MAG: Holliday junction branch migration DNA helicase RuvB [Candidatus Aminicenantia bacterium]
MRRISNPRPTEEDLRFEKNIRPRAFEDFIGQKNVKENLKIFIEAAKKRGESLDHVLLYGPPGLGKTSLAYIISYEMKASLKTSSGPAIEKGGDLAAILSNLEEGEILFIDEIHRLHPSVEEILYSAMEDFALDIVVGQGPSARTYKLSIPRFTLIGATTRAGLLSSPLRSRFGIIHYLGFYSTQELKQIVERTCKILGVSIDEDSAMEIGKRSRGTPRIAIRLLRRIRDFAQVKSKSHITLSLALSALEKLQIDSAGFDEVDRKILNTLILRFNGGPAGINAISASVNEDRETIEEIYEPYLVQEGYIIRTQKGRVATEKAYKHLGITPNPQQKLF